MNIGDKCIYIERHNDETYESPATVIAVENAYIEILCNRPQNGKWDEEIKKNRAINRCYADNRIKCYFDLSGSTNLKVPTWHPNLFKTVTREKHNSSTNYQN